MTTSEVLPEEADTVEGATPTGEETRLVIVSRWLARGRTDLAEGLRCGHLVELYEGSEARCEGV